VRGDGRGDAGAGAGARAIDTKTALDKLGFPADTQSQMLAGEFVETALLPLAFYELLDNYPKGAPADATEILYWSQFTAHGEDTIALVHTLQATFGGTLIGVQRHYYVSTGYNIEQAITGFLPAEEGTLVIYTNHTSTDQVAGFGSSVKRGIGRKFMAGELKKLFEKARATAAP